MSTANSKTALITGVTGQDGSYLAEQLLERGYRVFGMVRRSSQPSFSRIEHLVGDLELLEGELGDTGSITRIVRASQPDELYNLAAQSHVKVSFDTPEYTADVTAVGALRLLEAIRELSPKTRFYQASSSELYGRVVEVPQSETTPFHPRSPYAVAKAYAFHITRNYREAYGLFACNGILFNHESPRRAEAFVTRKISRAVARIKLGVQETLSLGNLDASRDWGFAGDYTEGMWLMLQADEPQDFVLAMGETHTVREFCDLAFARIGMPLEWRGEGLDEQGVDASGAVRVKVDPQFFRPAEVDLLLGDPTKAKTELGWHPKMSFEGLVHAMVDHDVVLCAAEEQVSKARV